MHMICQTGLRKEVFLFFDLHQGFFWQTFTKGKIKCGAMMNSFDATVIFYVNKLSRHSVSFDRFMGYAAQYNLLKGGMLALLIWRVWAMEGERGRKCMAAAITSCFAAIALARGLALSLPYRARPLHEYSIAFVPPHGVSQRVLDGWSSFPSDHAVLFFTLSTGLFFASRRLGALALAYSALVICLPRVYLGFHYPTDILAGAALGVIIGWMGSVYLASSRAFGSSYGWLVSRPGLFYPALFLVTYQIADLFDSGRGALSGAVELVEMIFA